MTSFEQLLQHGTASAWLFLPTAVVLGALHGLEPGHSKTMMAAFIVSIRGTIGQALLLGLSATISHTAIIWILAYAGLRYAAKLDVEKTEPYFQLASGVIILILAAWTFVRTRREKKEEAAHSHSHAHPHGPVGGGPNGEKLLPPCPIPTTITTTVNMTRMATITRVMMNTSIITAARGTATHPQISAARLPSAPL